MKRCQKCGKLRRFSRRGHCHKCYVGLKRNPWPKEPEEKGIAKKRPPIKAMPGTEEKIRILQNRLARGEPLFQDTDPIIRP